MVVTPGYWYAVIVSVGPVTGAHGAVTVIVQLSAGPCCAVALLRKWTVSVKIDAAGDGEDTYMATVQASMLDRMVKVCIVSESV